MGSSAVHMLLPLTVNNDHAGSCGLCHPSQSACAGVISVDGCRDLQPSAARVLTGLGGIFADVAAAYCCGVVCYRRGAFYDSIPQNDTNCVIGTIVVQTVQHYDSESDHRGVR